ncbi:NADH-quinone oxidoreductase subunit C [Zavarzinella formosa]|uniref:NADH-quinone oxidoreductase subunit C n=1 Tax=Zavarzinella formosa TaxID=360055 RepID=UPI000303E090|nr:NADH-quinone oxidoreductase subunit C [Zavarzinella formosa]
MTAWQTKLTETFGDACKFETFRDNIRCDVRTERFLEVMKNLRAQGFDLLLDVTGIDYLHYPKAADRYGVVYSLVNTESGERAYIKVRLNDPDPAVPSVYSIWKGCDWMERETYDMFGIVFEGHPDLRRILMPEEFTSFPLRKDYPLRGRGERHNFPTVLRSDG